MDTATKTEINDAKTSSKRVQKTAEATGNLKIVDKITSVGKS